MTMTMTMTSNEKEIKRMWTEDMEQKEKSSKSIDYQS